MESMEKKWDRVWVHFKDLPGDLREQSSIGELMRSMGLSVSNVCSGGAGSGPTITSFDIPKEELDKAERLFAELKPKNSSKSFSYYRYDPFWHKIDGEKQIVEKVNEILREVFGRNVGGNWIDRSIVLCVDNMYSQCESLYIVVRNSLMFETLIGHFERRDGSVLVLYPALLFGLWRRRQAKKYCKLYRERFGKEAFVKFSKS